jgi:hypothetical protein
MVHHCLVESTCQSVGLPAVDKAQKAGTFRSVSIFKVVHPETVDATAESGRAIPEGLADVDHHS